MNTPALPTEAKPLNPRGELWRIREYVRLCGLDLGPLKDLIPDEEFEVLKKHLDALDADLTNILADPDEDGE